MVATAFDLLILSNGPGEVMTWVAPVVQAVRQREPCRERVRISVILAPCSHSTGTETDVVRGFPEVDRVQGAAHFYPFLLWGKTAAAWAWRSRGIVLFLGGDQFFPVVIGRRLGYKIVIYAEWAARWARWVDRFAVTTAQVQAALPVRDRGKCRIVGDLMSDLAPTAPAPDPQAPELVGILPGSKAMKLAQGVPGTIAIAHHLHELRPETQFAIAVAPTVTMAQLYQFTDPTFNPIAATILADLKVELKHSVTATPYLFTNNGCKIELWTQFPHHEKLQQCTLCLTTIGANTAQLGALGIPMIVWLPTWQIDAMRAWDGLPGLLANLPILGTGFNRIFLTISCQIYFRQRRLYAWPNIWANQQEIVPEIFGKTTPLELAQRLNDYLNQPEKLAQMRQDLQRVRGATGASDRVAQLVFEILATD